MPLKDREREASLWPPEASSPFLSSAVSANRFQCFQKPRMSFDFIENEFKPKKFMWPPNLGLLPWHVAFHL
jgi:hypothetical protein